MSNYKTIGLLNLIKDLGSDGFYNIANGFK